MTALEYTSRIDPWASEPLTGDASSEVEAPDRRDGRVYDFGAELRLAVEVALVTGRPLLLRGEPGSGKSSLAAFVARNLGYRYYEHTVTSTTRAQDLLWRYDTVRRLSDAQVTGRELRDENYIEPGPLWWAFDSASAERRGVPDSQPEPEPLARDPHEELNAPRRDDGAVVLVDEIDKADPDVPNGLLGPLGTTSFVVSETGAEVKRPMRTERELAVDPVSLLLVVITTNEERDLPAAFTRRCVAHHLRHPGAERLVQIARLHFGHAAGFDETLARALASRIDALRTDAVDESRRPPSTAEYLDAVRACHALGVSADDTTGAWSVIERATLAKDAPAAT